METKIVNKVRCYEGDIMPEEGVVFVFGSNPEGRHGAGAARVARERFGAVYGRGEGLQGNAYAIPTKDLRVRENNGFRSVSPEAITEAVGRMYDVARQNPDKLFCVAYRNTDRRSLNGYTGYEMMDMFAAAGDIPQNVAFSEEWARSGRLRIAEVMDEETNKNQDIMPNINFLQTESSGYQERTRINAEAADITVAVAVDYNTYGERATLRDAGPKYIPIPIDAEGVHGRSADAMREEARLAAREFIEKARRANLPLDGITLNIAGNGIQTLAREGITQRDVDTFMTDFIAALQGSGEVTISAIRSGGQTGIDEAGIKAAAAAGIDATVLAPKGWRYRDAQGHDRYDEAAFKNRFGVAVAERQGQEVAGWARRAENGFEVSTQGTALGRQYSSMVAKFEPGTVLRIGDREVQAGGRTIEDIYQTEVKRSGKNHPPREDSVLFIPDAERGGMSESEMEDRSYERGFFPLWAVWAQQHPREVEALREAAEGRPLTDVFARGRVSQARALADVLSGRQVEPSVARVFDRSVAEEMDRARAAQEAEQAAVARGEAIRQNPFLADPTALDLAYSIAYGSSLFTDDTAAVMRERISAMSDDDRDLFRTAVLQEIDRLYPNLRGRNAAARQANGMNSPEKVLDGILVSAVGMEKLTTNLDARREELEAQIEPFMQRHAPLAEFRPLVQEYNEVSRRLSVLRSVNTEASPMSVLSRPEHDITTGAYSLDGMRFQTGTKLGVIDIGGMSVADVYWRFVAQSNPGEEPRPGTIVASAADTPRIEREETVYFNGILPLVSLWCSQHHSEVAQLKAALVRQDVGGAVPAERLTDRSGTRFSSVRALTDYINGRAGRYEQQELDRYFSTVPRIAPAAGLTPDALEGYDVYTVGTSRRSDREFWSLIPEDTDVVIDVRHNRNPAVKPRPGEDVGNFKSWNMRKVAGTQGMDYVEMPEADGAPAITRQNQRQMLADPRVVTEKTKVSTDDQGRFRVKAVYDYGAIADSDSFRSAMDKVERYVREGKKVCIVGAEGNPATSARALLVGQYLERNKDLHVAHIDTNLGGHARVRSQEEVVVSSLGRMRDLRNKNYGLVQYHSDGTVILPPGEEIVERSINGRDDVNARLRAGEQMPWNYGTEVEFRKVSPPAGLRSGQRSSGHHAGIVANVENADFTVVFYAEDRNSSARDRSRNNARSLDPQVSEIRNAAIDRFDIRIPTRKEDWDEQIIKQSDALVNRMTNNLAYRYASFGERYFRLDALKVFVGGSTLPNISSVTQFDHDDEMMKARVRKSMAGYGLDDYTDITQEDVNMFVGEVLRRAFSKQQSLTDGAGNDIPYKVTEITSNFDTGVGEAAIVAAQQMGIKPTVIYTAPVVTIENDTSLGFEMRDEAPFRNRARGKREDVTVAMLQEQIDEKEELDRERSLGLTPGLSDRQVVALWNMGYGNTELMDIIDIVGRNSMTVSSDKDFAELVDIVRSYGIEIPQHDGAVEEAAARALRQADEQLAQWKEDGITVVSAASPLYPDTLSQMPDETVTDYVTVTDEEGHEGQMPQDSVVRRPALLWAKGDLRLLQETSVGIIHDPDTITSVEDKSAIRRFTTVVAENEMPLVVSLDGGANTALDMIDNNGKVIAFSSDGIPTGGTERKRIEDLTNDIDRLNRIRNGMRAVPAEVLSNAIDALRRDGFVTMDAFDGIVMEARPDMVELFSEHKDVILASADAHPADGDIRVAMGHDIDDLSAQRAVLQREVNKTDDISDSIVHGGGVHISTMAPGTKADPERKKDNRENKLVGALSNVATIFADISSPRPAGPIEFLLSLPAGAINGVTWLVNKISDAKALPARLEEMQSRKEDRGGKSKKKADIAEVDFTEVKEDSMKKDIIGKARANKAALESEISENQQKQESLAAAEEKQSMRSAIPKLAPFKDSRLVNRFVVAAKTAFDAVLEGFGVPVKQGQAKIDVLHMRDGDVFAVPEGQEEIEHALVRKYGAKISIVTPVGMRRLMEDYERGAVYVDGTRIERYPGGEVTAAVREPVRMSCVYYNAGKVMDLMEVPNGSMGLPSPAERRAAVKGWDMLVNHVRGLQAEFQEMTGVAPGGQVRYQNADHLRVSSTSIDVMRGDEMRARIWFEDGEIHARNFDLRSDDFQEYHETPTYPVFSNIPKVIGPGTFGILVEDLRNTLFDRPTLELRSIQEAETNPELQAEREEKIRNGFLKPRASNVGIASDDVGEAVANGVVNGKDAATALTVDERIRLYAAVKRIENNDAKKMATLERKIKTTEKALGKTTDEDEIESLKATLTDAYATRSTIAVRLADTVDLKIALQQGGDKVLMVGKAGKEERITNVSLGGRPVAVPVGNLKKEAIDAAREELNLVVTGGVKEEEPENVAEGKDETENKSVKEEKAETVNVADEKAALGEWLSKAEKDPEMKASQEYQEKLGRLQDILNAENAEPVREGVSADGVADKTYAEVRPLGGGFSMGRFDDGSFLVLDKGGLPVSDVRFTNIYAPTEGVNILQGQDGRFRYFDFGNGRQLGGSYVKAGNFYDGRALVLNDEGRYNYVKIEDGSLLLKNMWLDDARRFSEGRARCRIGDKVLIIDTEARQLKKISPEKSKQQQRPGGNGKSFHKKD